MTAAVRVVLAIAWLTIVGCGSDPAEPATKSTSTRASSATTAAPARTIVGRWERVQTCSELLRALHQADLSAVAPGVLLDFFPDSTPGRLARKPQPCKGAKARPHSHFFTKDGEFGSVDEDNQRVDDDSYRVVDEDTIRIGRSRFDYRIAGGDTLILRPVISATARRRALAHPKQFSEAGWQVAVSYMGLPWKRVSCNGWC